MKPTPEELKTYQNDPFSTGRSTARLLFDFSIGISFFTEPVSGQNILDIACGTGWTSEMLSKIGYNVYGFDIDEEVIEIAKTRSPLDSRIDPKRLHFSVSDAQNLPFEDGSFSYTFCFDSLHHFPSYRDVFTELYRLLKPGGKAVFVEPGSRHSKSPETIAFLAKHSHEHGEYWYEKDVDLLEVHDLTQEIGFAEFEIKPFLYPTMVGYSANDWNHILQNTQGQKNYLQEFRRFNFEDRIIFAVTK